ncbi:MFS transporter [Pseudonocardia sp. TRM90224]|uniref:MFS transporter n=1 Tax=Pseudonocardia sp. TRM90224 TaxID=2812678 RepID=UPI001E383144|nr:MFS transporter [Pseudonocardia sp. TRM90224]
MSPVYRMLLGRTLSALGTALVPVMLTLAVLRISGSAGDVGLVLACELLPMLVLLPVGGVVADRVHPAKVLLGADLVRFAAQLAIGIQLVLGGAGIAWLAGLSALTGVAIAFGSPAVPTLVAAAVAAPDRLRVNTRIGMATGLSAVVAPALCGAVVLVAGPGAVALLAAALFAASALTLGGVRTPAAARPSTGAHLGFRTQLQEGWTEVRSRRWFLLSVLGHAVWHFAAGFFLAIGPVIAVRELGGEPAWVLIVQSGTAGMLIGVFAAPRLRITRPLAVCTIGVALLGLPLTALAVGASVVVVACAYLVAMLGLGLLIPLWETVVADRVPQHALGRVRSFDSLLSFAARPLGLAVAGPIAAVAGPAVPLLVCAALVTVVGVGTLGVRAVRERQQPAVSR